MFNYAYDNYENTTIKNRDEIIDTTEIKNGTKETKDLKLSLKDDLIAFVPKDFDSNNLSYKINLNDNLYAPIITGDTVGTVTYTVNDTDYTIDLLAGSTVYEKTDISIYLVIAGLTLLLFAIILMPKKKRNKRK